MKQRYGQPYFLNIDNQTKLPLIVLFCYFSDKIIHNGYSIEY